MSDAIWYYAKDDEQLGPVSPAQLKALATSGKLVPSDLVWKEGMADWTAAMGVKGLFLTAAATPPPATTAGKPAPSAEAGANLPLPNSGATNNHHAEKSSEPSLAETSGSGSAVPTNPPPQPTSPPPTPPLQPPQPLVPQPPASGSRWANPPPPPEPAVVEAAPAIAAPRISQRYAARSMSSALLSLGRLLMCLGLLLVLLVRGCDSLAQRNAERHAAQYELAQAHFDDEWDEKRAKLDASEEGVAVAAHLEEQQKARDALEAKEWKSMRLAARDARLNQQVWGYWRQMIFVPAAMVFVAGLLLISATADGSERWGVLVMLGVVIFSLFVGGVAWTG